jgi:2-dehydro-3-deoxygluconokinase
VADSPLTVCIGESLAVLQPAIPGPLADVATFTRTAGGAESNVARGLVGLGLRAAWVGAVGDDGFGEHLLRTLAADGVDTSGATIDRARPTGLYVKETREGRSVPHYYRAASAAAALGPEALQAPAVKALLADAALVHVSGITAALSDSCLELLRAALTIEGPLVSIDLNWRAALWQGRDPGVLRGLLDAADIVLLGADEAGEVLGTTDPAQLRALLPNPRTLVIKDGATRALAVEKSRTTVVPALGVDVVEPVGAGDAFAAGYLGGLLQGYDQARRLRLGHLLAASALVVADDYAPPPASAVLAKWLAYTESQWAAARVDGTGLR